MCEEKSSTNVDVQMNSKETIEQTTSNNESNDKPQTSSEQDLDQTSSGETQNKAKDDSSQKKRKNEFKDSNRTKKKLSKDDFEIRFLISNKDAGLLIGKKGSNITFLRQNFNCSVMVTDCLGPERVLSLTINSSQIEQILASIIGYLEENNQNPSIELRLLLHTNWCGSLIGKNGSKLKDIRQKNNTSVKIFPQCCPRSSERICIIQGQPSNVICCIRTILDIVFTQQQTGKIFYYNPANYSANDALNYGGFLPDYNIKNYRNVRRSSNNNNRQKGNSNRKRFNQNNFNQSEIWNTQDVSQQQTFFNNNNWQQTASSNQMNHQQMNQMFNSTYQLPHQQPLTDSLTNYQPGNYQPQNVPYYLDSSSGYPSNTTNQLQYNSNDLNNQMNQLNANPLNSSQLNTFWSSYYNSDKTNKLNLSINSESRSIKSLKSLVTVPTNVGF